MKKVIFALFSFLLVGSVWAVESAYPLEDPKNNLRDKASLQRGAKLYMNYCLGCHSLKYTRYSQIGQYIGAVDEEGEILDKLVQQNLNFVTDKVTDPVIHSMPEADASKWFGKAPPDLTLVTRVRGTDWVYTYLKSFYVDESRPWGVNNAVFPDVGMPHVLLPLQGQQVPVYHTQNSLDEESESPAPVISAFELTEQGELDSKAYEQAITDLVNFLEFVGEPVKEKRTRLGVFVLLFLIVLTVFLYALKREYWKDVH